MAATVQDLTRWVQLFGEAVAQHQGELTDLDRAIGDADHGSNLARGMQAVLAKLAETPPATVAELGKSVGMTLVGTVGGASGPLYGTFFLRFGTGAGAVDALEPAGLADALGAGVDGVIQRGKAEPADKTMVDALAPAVQELAAAVAAGTALPQALQAAASAAEAGRDATEALVARKGRASYLGERSAGHIDPGAASSALLIRALATALAD